MTICPLKCTPHAHKVARPCILWFQLELLNLTMNLWIGFYSNGKEYRQKVLFRIQNRSEFRLRWLLIKNSVHEPNAHQRFCLVLQFIALFCCSLTSFGNPGNIIVIMNVTQFDKETVIECVTFICHYRCFYSFFRKVGL